MWCVAVIMLNLPPKLRQLLPVGLQVIVQNLSAYVHIGDDRIKQEALEGGLAVAVNGGIDTEADDSQLPAAQFGNSLGQGADPYSPDAKAADQARRFHNRPFRQ